MIFFPVLYKATKTIHLFKKPSSQNDFKLLFLQCTYDFKYDKSKKGCMSPTKVIL